MTIEQTAADHAAFAAQHNATRRTGIYTVWQGRGSKRVCVGTAETPETARALAHGNAPAAVWALDCDEPLLTTGRRAAKNGESYTVEVRGAWAGGRLADDVATMAAAVDGQPSPIRDLRRARRAAAILRAGFYRFGGKAYRVAEVNIKVESDGTVRRKL